MSRLTNCYPRRAYRGPKCNETTTWNTLRCLQWPQESNGFKETFDVVMAHNAGAACVESNQRSITMERLRERTIQYVLLAIVASSGGLFQEGRHSPVIITSITYKPIEPQTSLVPLSFRQKSPRALSPPPIDPSHVSVRYICCQDNHILISLNNPTPTATDSTGSRCFSLKYSLNYYPCQHLPPPSSLICTCTLCYCFTR